MSTFFRTQMTGRRGNPLVLRKILPNPDLVIASTGADIGFYIVSLVGQVIIKYKHFPPKSQHLCSFRDDTSLQHPGRHSKIAKNNPLLPVVSFWGE